MTDADLLIELKDRFRYATTEWSDIRAEGKTDMRYVSGDPWEPAERTARVDAGRPCISPDELNQYVNQLINDIRQNKRAIKATPQGNGATDQTAELRANLIRQIEYRSNAQQAYTTMFENAAQRGYGFGRVKSKFISDESFDHELVIEPIVNPDLVTPDPDAIRTDGSDWKYLFYHETIALADFKRDYPKAKIQDFSKEIQASASSWFKGERIQIAEYWKIETKRRERLLLQTAKGPLGVWADELHTRPAKAHILKSREVDLPSVMQYLTNGVEILKRIPWKGKSLPWVACYGKVLYLDTGSGSKRRLLSMIRLARDPQMLYAYYRTQQAEMAGMIPKASVMAYEGQMRGHETDWQRMNHEPVAFVYFKAVTDATGATILPPPSRLAYEAGAHLQSLELCAEGARRAIQAAMGVSPLPTQAQRRNEKSGVALKQMEDSAQKGSFHFVDHYDEAVTRFGQLLEENIGWAYDTARDVTTRQPDDTAKIVRINDPGATNRDTGKPEHLPTDVGSHDVTLSVGPKMDSEREAAMSFGQLLLATPQAPLILDLIVKAQNLGPLGDEMAERVTPPQFKKPKEGQADPAQMAQQLQQLSQQHDLLVKELDAKNKVIETDSIKAEAHKSEAMEVQRLRNAGALAVAETNARAKGVQSANEAQVDALALLSEQMHDSDMADKGQAHEAGMAAAGQAGDAQAQASDQAHASETQAADHAQASDLQGQQLDAAAQQAEAGNGAGA